MRQCIWFCFVCMGWFISFHEGTAEGLGILSREVFQQSISSVHQLTDEKGIPLQGDGIRIAIIDSGMNADDVRDTMVDRFNFLNHSEDITDDHGHGTIVMDIITSVAPKARILGYKVLDDTLAGTEENIIAAIQRAVHHKANVINLSFGDPHRITYEQDNPLTMAIEEAVRKGVSVVVSAGNKGKRWGIFSPGSSPLSITVGATTDSCTKVAEYSNQGPILGTWEIKPDVLGPGTYVKNDRINRGTSFSAPYISAIIALMQQQHPQWSPQQIKSALATTATILKEQDQSISPVAQGSGLVNPYKALGTSTLFFPIHISFDPTEMADGEVTQTKTLTIENIGEIENEYSLTLKWDHLGEGIVCGVEPSVNLAPLEKKQVNLCLQTMGTTQPGCYTGQLCVETNTETWHIPIVVLLLKNGDIPSS